MTPSGPLVSGAAAASTRARFPARLLTGPSIAVCAAWLASPPPSCVPLHQPTAPPESAGYEDGDRPWTKQFVDTPASRDPEPGATRLRPLIYV